MTYRLECSARFDIWAKGIALPTTMNYYYYCYVEPLNRWIRLNSVFRVWQCVTQSNTEPFAWKGLDRLPAGRAENIEMYSFLVCSDSVATAAAIRRCGCDWQLDREVIVERLMNRWNILTFAVWKCAFLLSFNRMSMAEIYWIGNRIVWLEHCLGCH